ncbi:nucleophile aminohydrolase [Aspergillus egyptiacus]|nr:nucleophile aminohydrolase [Aspergillus egyptiacus]
MPSPPALFKPTLILHGGAGAMHRSALPPPLWSKYQSSLLSYLRSTKHLLDTGATALDAAVHAVSLMEDDELFNCGRGSVFTSAGTIEMEASVMVTSVDSERQREKNEGEMKRGAGVICIRNVRHPIQLAREVLLRTGQDEDGNPVKDGSGGGGSMHCQLSGPYVEDLARAWGLERMPDEWFWTERRWEEHRRGLEKGSGSRTEISESAPAPASMLDDDLEIDYPSQGTVGCICLDQWGGLAVATSTGGRTNKFPGRVGDTPTLGAGFWAEGWEVDALGGDGDTPLPMHSSDEMRYASQPCPENMGMRGGKSIWDMTLGDCFQSLLSTIFGYTPRRTTFEQSTPLLHQHRYDTKQPSRNSDQKHPHHSRRPRKRRAAAVSGTGSGDSFLRTAAARTTCAMMRFSPNELSLADAVSAVAGPDGELQRSAGRRWGRTAEGQGGMIGIEAEVDVEVDDGREVATGLRRGKIVFDFNCGGMFRAWFDQDADGNDVERAMVFKEEYE